MSQLAPSTPAPVARGLPDLTRHWRRSWKRTWVFLKRHRWSFLAALILSLLPVVFYSFSHDLDWSRAVVGNGKHRKLAQEIGGWGSVAQYNLLIVSAIWVWGHLRKSHFLRRLAMAATVATILAGLFCNTFRFTLGRPRPFTKQPPMEFRGPQMNPHFHGFPSGHVSTAFGTAIPVLVVLPEVGVPVTLFAGAMGWARMYDRQHYPSDVWVGAWIGILSGIAAGVPLLRVRRRLRSRVKARGRGATGLPVSTRKEGAPPNCCGRH